MTASPIPPRTLLCAMSLALAVGAGACGDFIEFEPMDASALGDAGAGGSRQFYATCAATLADAEPVETDALGEVLARRVSAGVGGFALVDYVGWSSSPDDIATLDTYLAAVSDAAPGDCALAFWINAYNATVLRAVLSAFDGDTGYSVAADDFAFFRRPRHPVAGLLLSLDELEHGVIRGDWAHASIVSSALLPDLKVAHARLWQGTGLDARIHMALNCAARGCPNLASTPYTGATLDAQLRAATRTFLANPAKGAGPDGVSQIFQWFSVDFVADAGSIEAFIAAHRDGGRTGVDVDAFIEYDWSLNTQ